MLFGCQSKDNFNGGFALLSSQNSEPNGWYATRLPQTNAFTHFEVDPNHPQDEIAYNWTRVYEDERSLSPGFILIQCWDEKQDMIGIESPVNRGGKVWFDDIKIH